MDERKKKGTGYSKKKSKAKTAQDTIPFDEIYENGLFRSEETFTIIFQLENLDYKVMRENEKDSFYEKYMHFLNTLPQDVQYQELVMNYPTDRKMLEDAIIPKRENTICSRAVHRDYCQVMEGIIDTAANQSCEQVILAAMSYKPQTKLNYSSKTLEVDDAIQLSAAVSPSNANQAVSWSSSNSSVVSVNNGKITAKRVGKATITATAGNGKSASCEVTVRKKEQTDSVHLSASEYHISVGQTITVTLYGTSKVTWSVSNSNPVTFTSNKNEAKVKARRKGNTQLYAKDNATGKVYICDIYVG